MASSSSFFPRVTSVPSLKELVATHLTNQLGSVSAVKEFISENANIAFEPMLEGQLERLQSQFKKLLEHVVLGNQKEAEDIIKENPNLLLYKRTVVDYSGRIIEGTALQIALGAEDVRFHDDEVAMVEMIMRHLKKLPDGELKIQKQIQQQFPEGWEIKENERAQNDLTALNKVIKTISDAQPNDDCEAALEEFRNHLKPKGVITTGKHFNAQLLVEAYKLYIKNYDSFGGKSAKNKLVWRKVIGYIQRFLPANYAQAFCRGVHSVVLHGERLNRSLKFRFDNDVSFFPLDTNSDKRLGFNFALRGCGEKGKRNATPAMVSLCLKDYANLIEKKTLRLQELCKVQKFRLTI
ncbi:MAG: hypothetical protein P4M12_03555 [Gammaproteobacteria bacterium]|nr:hypothetical protein [Gammaproteobacteria bacterium]